MNETFIRLGVFAGVLILFSSLEALFPRRDRILSRNTRWITNFGFTVINSFAVRLLGPLTAMGVAAWATENNIGLFNLTSAPLWVEGFAAFILLDFAIYLQHVISHKVPIFWRFHKVHHTDRDLDASSALRFHPIEILLSMVYKCGLMLLLGPSVIAVLIFEVVLNASAIFNHANMKLPLWLDAILRPFIVTPDMHRVHHSTIMTETNSNYGFNLSIWDRLCRTYKAQPNAGHDAMEIGLSEHQDNHPGKLLWSLALPFAKSTK